MVKKKKAGEKPGVATDELVLNDVVEIHGLQGAKELNGRRGTLVAYVEESGRFGVKLDGENETKAVKPANLRRVESPMPSAAEIKELTRAAMERQLNEVVRKIKTAEEGGEERSALQKELAELVAQLKNLNEMPGEPTPPTTPAAKSQPTTPAAKPQPKPKVQGLAKAHGPVAPIGLQPPPLPRDQHNPVPPRDSQQTPRRQPNPQEAQQPPLKMDTPRAQQEQQQQQQQKQLQQLQQLLQQQQQPTPQQPQPSPRQKAPQAQPPAKAAAPVPQSQPQPAPQPQPQQNAPPPQPATKAPAPAASNAQTTQQPQQEQLRTQAKQAGPPPHAREHRATTVQKLATPPPNLPERPSATALAAAAIKTPPVYLDEAEYPDPARAHQSFKVAVGAFVLGIITSQLDFCPASWFVWSFLAVHLFGVIFLTDYAKEGGLLALCGVFGVHMGFATSEVILWALQRDGEDSVGPWSILVVYACILYLHSFWSECLTLPPDYITSISMFFPMFPAFNAAVVMSCLELFVEWRYFPQYKLQPLAVLAGAVLMGVGQTLIVSASRTAERNFWASCRNKPEDEEAPEDFVDLEIPNRRIVMEGAYRWERHPAYLGAMLWGVGAEIALCNPLMFFIVGFVLWASLLYVALEEEQELYDEFKGSYANYSALTRCWIPLFNSFLENAAFQREMSDNLEDGDAVDEDLEEEEEEEGEEAEEVHSEDDMLPTWEGVPRGGALWNRQFREPWLLG